MSEKKSTVLIVDDEPSLRELLSVVLEVEGYEVQCASNGVEALAVFDRCDGEIEVVIQDVRMPGMSGLDLLKHWKRRAPQLPVIVVTAFSTWDDAVEAMRLGAYNYLRKPFDTDMIRKVVRGAVLRTSRRSDASAGCYRDIIGNHRSLQDVLEMVSRVARTESTVLIQGESGTGKEMIARTIHLQSARHDRPFLPVNCSAFAESLLESELFGHVRGAFTGALEDQDGVFAAAEGGTIFLDEIGDTSLSTQVKLLRVLEERCISPVGSSRIVPIDVRVVAATNRDLVRETAVGTFREDLYYRLNVIPLHMPPLRERKDDIPFLVGHFLAKYSERMGKNVTRISDDGLRALARYDWPGNVRELENIVQRHVALADGEEIETVELPGSSSTAHAEAPIVTPDNVVLPREGFDLQQRLDDIERRYIDQALEQSGGQMTKAARLLGMSYRSMRYRVKKLGLRETREA